MKLIIKLLGYHLFFAVFLGIYYIPAIAAYNQSNGVFGLVSSYMAFDQANQQFDNPQEALKGLEQLKKAAKQGNTTAQSELGNRYYHGHGVKQHYAKALYWFEKAAIKGDQEAQSFLGWMYKKGQGVKQDYTKARKWLKKPAASGSSFAQLGLAEIYFWGEGIKPDYEKAIQYYIQSAEQGHPGSPHLISTFFSELPSSIRHECFNELYKNVLNMLRAME